MDLGTITALAVFLLICLILIVITGRNSRKKEKQFLQAFYGLAEKHQCKIFQYDRWRSTAIGIDENSGKVFFIRKLGGKEILQYINLEEILRCRVISTTRNVSSKEGKIKVTDKLELAFTYRDKNSPEIYLEFYNADYESLTLRGELQMAEKWCEIANARIASLIQQK